MRSFYTSGNPERAPVSFLTAMTMIDLRSDTLTVPTSDMREAMARAPVGDDVYGEDSTINELQRYVAELLGKEAALYVPSGCMGNQICLKIHTKTGDEVIVDSEAHIFHYETAAPSIISGVQLHPVRSQNGVFALDDVREAIRPSQYYFPETTLFCMENTHNRYGGTVIPLEHIRECEQVAREHGLAFHCDGARLWNACAATGISPAEYAAPFDTLSVCLSKGLGAPVGSLIVGTHEHIDRARKWRKILGGGMRQAGILAAAGLYVLHHHRDLLQQDHINAASFTRILAQSDHINIDPASVQTNIVVFGYPADVNFVVFAERCKERNVLISASRPGYARAVFYHQIDASAAEEAARVVVETLEVLCSR